MNLKYNVSLKEKHTFGLEASAEAFVKIQNVSQIKTALQLPYKSKMVLGGGSNVVFTQDYLGLVMKLVIKGIQVEREYKNSIHLKVGGGENWHKTVLWTLRNNYGGLENLSLIPGKVGASPIQNIGAYGVELKDVFVKLKALDIATGKVKTFFKKDCQFGYRDSFFKNKGKGKYIILEVYFSLTKNNHKLNTAYGAIKTELEKKKITNPTIQDISKAVIKIRRSKLPDPKKIGNAGSFFKNPIISKTKFKTIHKKFPKLVHYPAPNGKVKLAAGWLIDQCNWKGKSIGGIMVHPKQALVLTNQGKGEAKDLQKMIKKIITSVKKKYDVSLEAEVNLI